MVDSSLLFGGRFEPGRSDRSRVACPEIASGSAFTGRLLAHINCQAETIGSYGYGALADPHSTVSIALTGLLTLFVAIFGIRLMLDYPTFGRDLVGSILKIGIVLTLATSWPAWRVIGYDLIVNGPAEVAGTIAGSTGFPAGNGELRDRLQSADDGLVAVTTYGTGRLPGVDQREDFRGNPLPDESGFGWGRLFFLVGTIAPYAIVRLGGGILLALAPLFSFLLLFDGASSLFFGWLRGLAFAALGSLAITLIQGVQLAVLEPWITDALARRASGEFAPAAATEMAALAFVFLAVTTGILLLIARVSFVSHFSARAVIAGNTNSTIEREGQSLVSEVSRASVETRTRAHATVASVAATLRREEIEARGGPGFGSGGGPVSRETQAPGARRHHGEVLGSTFRRNHHRVSVASERRDRKA